ncbi:ATP-binding cassette domain-containing protein [Bizionia myxarmorum]|uniref:ATP-binding cassette domain-containing protein n=1 Tax=Bizionia myxarmorum TaxID=291186 RepID=A0A5D0RD99_9FLAO|nr:ATP-binding cassette domain-containing protein [Bizionia myxarmorum]TYB79527.1 ATP-binding cassette domain-containing protein [Bizionia myxarmorum]
MILELDNVELYFKEKRILNGIYLKAETGKVTGILGSNGCGKSCIINIIFGTLTPKYKLVRLDSKPILKPLYQTNLVKFLPQLPIAPNSSKLKTAFTLFQVNWDEFTTHFKSFVIYKNFKFRQLSGGERRVIETYLVLKSPTKIVLLDEPFSHVAPLYIETIKKLIAEEKKHKIIIITDHLFRDIIETSDNLYLIKDGHSKLITDLKILEDYKYISENTL